MRGALRRNLRAAADEQGVRGAGRYLQSALVRANEFVDELARSAVFHKTMRRTGGTATTTRDAVGRKRTAWKGGDRDAAVQSAFQELIDYTDLSPIERTYVRAAIPFYAWQKGILKRVANLAVDDPAKLRVMMLLHEVNSDMAREQFGELPGFYEEGLVPFRQGALSIRSLNPFSDSASLVTSEGIASSINPILGLTLRGIFNNPEFLSQGDWQPDRFGFARPRVDIGRGLSDVYLRTPPFRYLQGDLEAFPLRTYDAARVRGLLARETPDSGGTAAALVAAMRA